ncbi:hypothetical protein BU24DRAFT_425438 [Aaosphaeria arxii CBS 175.79]|uniref:Uncharacterized protein n=1 Tax=Aaosphaeria arxii CBS 175.79 TaxID=1450172 RepID=A0A6A5XI76_9PLEO|nr:uncharacterized protein BU24DRAFT_425438 [Aaosphaeria arxii CBS 175.79]KAF2012822.1 hypothetical protein BU24DRAFT_425438 [Aaosphaeria arxii CBS 175.79]
MADSDPYEDDLGESGELAAEDLFSVDMSLDPEGDESGYHITNDKDDPFQRQHITERKGRVDVRCDLKDVAHGYFSADNDDLCTLIVIEFRFEPNGLANRIRQANIDITFSAIEKGNRDPEVIEMHPNGSFGIEPTQASVSTTKGGGLNLGAGAGPVNLGGDLKLERTVERQRPDMARLRGSIDLPRSRNNGVKSAVSWGLTENATDETGIISLLRASILLKRRDMAHFKAKVNIKVKADLQSQFGAFFKSVPKDDDVLFNPERDPTNKLQKYDIENLGLIDLKSLSDVTYQTFLKGTVKEQ